MAVISAGIGNPVDDSTYSNTHEVKTTHVHLDFEVDFPNRKFDGTVTHNMSIIADGVTDAFFDIQGVYVERVQASFNGNTVDALYYITSPKPLIGDALRVALPQSMQGNGN